MTGFTPDTFVDGSGGGTPITAAKLNKLETEEAALDVMLLGTASVKSFGAIGDGTSRPLSTLYGTLAAAQAVYPAANALTDELDFVAIQKAINSTGAVRIHYPAGHYLTNRMLLPKNGQTHYGVGPSSWIENIHARNTPSLYQTEAGMFQVGNAHPIMLNPTYPTYNWQMVDINAVVAGDYTVTVTTPANVTAPLAVGDIVMFKSDGPAADGNTGIMYDYLQWNKVTAWNAGTGTLSVELPIPVTIASGKPKTVADAGAPVATTLTLGTTSTTGGVFYAAGTYFWKVVAFNASGDSLGSNEVTATIAVNGKQVLTWTSSAGATGYRIHRGTVAGAENVLVASVGAVLTYTDIGPGLILTTPQLCVNNNSNLVNGYPWWTAQNITIRDMKLSCTTAFGPSSAWRCKFQNLYLDTQDMISANAWVLCEADNIQGYFSGRCLEVAHTSSETTFTNIKGTYKYDSTNPTPNPAINIGEQSNRILIDNLIVNIGNTYTPSSRILQIGGIQGLKMRDCRLNYHGSGTANGDVWWLASTANLGRPPSDIDLDLTVRTSIPSAIPQFGTIGNDLNLDAIANEGDPVRVRLKLNQQYSGTAVAPGYAFKMLRGTKIWVDSIQGDALGVNVASPAEVPENCVYLIGTTPGPITVGANAEVSLGSFTLTGAKIGDYCRSSIQQIGTVTAGVFADLITTAVVTGPAVTIYVRNRSATAVTVTGATAWWNYIVWQRMRL